MPTLTLWHKHMTKFFRSGEAAFGMLLQPILWGRSLRAGDGITARYGRIVTRR